MLTDPLRSVSRLLIVWGGVVGTAFYTLAPGFVGALVDFGALTAEQAGQVASSHLIGLTVGPLLALLSSNRMRTRQWMIWGIGGAVVGHGTCALLQGFAPLVSMQFIAGAGSGLVLSSVTVIAGSEERPESCYAWMFGGQMVFGAIGFVVMPLILPRVGLSVAFAMLVGMALPLVLFLRQIPQYSASARGHDYKFRWSLQAVLILFSLFLHYVANSAVWAYLDRIGVAAGLTVDHVGIVLGISMLGSVIGPILVAPATRRFPIYRCIVVGIVLIAASSALLMSTLSELTYGFAGFLFLATLAFTVPIYQGVLAAIDPSLRFVLFGNLALTVGGGIGPALGSQLIGAHSFDLLLVTSIGIFGLATVAVLLSQTRLLKGES